MITLGKIQPKHLVLSGGVGGAKLVLGLSHALPPESLHVVVNSADDFVHQGLYVCPDIDTLIYTLAGLNNRELGWGRADETWNYMQACEELGLEHWFRLGDKDLALHVHRTRQLAQGAALSGVVDDLCTRFGITVKLMPMSDDPVRTFVESGAGRLAFQEYFVKHACEPVVHDIVFDGAETARPCAGIPAILEDPGLQAVIIAPSNPFLSIRPILSCGGLQKTLSRTRAPCVVVSPIVQGQALKGPTAKLMRELGLDCDVPAIAGLYADIADGIVIDARDAGHVAAIEARGLRVMTTDIIMQSLRDRIRLAREVVGFARTLWAGEDD